MTRLFFILVFSPFLCYGQNFTTKEKDYNFQIQHEIVAGHLVANFPRFPSSKGRLGYQTTLLWQKKDRSDIVNQYYGNPWFGLQAGVHNLGNPEVLGYKYDLVPVFLKPLWKGGFHFGLGLAYATKHYGLNNDNLVLGSHLNWVFELMYYFNIRMGSNMLLKVGTGYYHSSNGHTQLPNFGLNSAVLTLGVAHAKDSYEFSKTKAKKEFEKDVTTYARLSIGLGLHEFGGTTGPIGGPKKMVYTTSAHIGWQFKGQMRWYIGLGARHYQSYADSLTNNPELANMGVTANNVFISSGLEFLVYHVGMTFEGGINLYKPFYEHFAEEHESTKGWQYLTKKIFLSRMGIRLYLLNTAKRPKHNFYLAPFINANFGEADFSEISFGYVRRL